MKSALTIAGSDPTGGAGLQMDLKVFGTFGVYGYSAAAALTAQSTAGVADVIAVEKGFFERQLNTLLLDLTPDAMKTGMLYSPDIAGVVAEAVKKHSLKNLVVDPVTVSSTGVRLEEDGLLEAIKNLLFPLARVVTPNIYEASVLTGLAVEGESEMEQAARALMGMGPEAVIITGGHLDNFVLDLFFDGSVFERLRGRKIEGEYHGTGCAFSAAIAALLALGKNPLDAARGAREFVERAIQGAHRPGRGLGLLNI